MDDHTLAKALAIMLEQWPQTFHCNDVVAFIDRGAEGTAAQLRALLYPDAPPAVGISTPSSVGNLLYRCIYKPVRLGDRTLILHRLKQGRRPAYRVDD